ncbi:MAG: dUTP diphosphatase [Ignavibacteriaceae bacterium]|nr:dUTP diphosphatase [Ignavibacteriaceae bacterium]
MKQNEIPVYFKRVISDFQDIPLPAYQTDGSAGLDIRAAIAEPITIQPGKFMKIPTNLTSEIPPGYEIQVRPRSGLAAKHGVTVLNSPGTIDSDYRGEIQVILINHGVEPFEIHRGDRIAQLVLAQVTRMDVAETLSVSDTKRGSGGFGSSGKK